MIEKKNKLAIHAIFDSKESGERFLHEVVPDYVRRGFYIDKTLTEKDFEIKEYK